MYTLISFDICIHHETVPTIKPVNTPMAHRHASCPFVLPGSPQPAAASDLLSPRTSLHFLTCYMCALVRYVLLYGLGLSCSIVSVSLICGVPY